MKGCVSSEYEIHPSASRSMLLSVLGDEWFRADTFIGGSGYSIDTRTLRVGEIFIALRTEQRDGHQFLEAAREAGASAAIVEEFQRDVPLPQVLVSSPLKALQRLAHTYRQSLSGCTFIGVTGSCGKTSTKELLGLLLGESGEVFVSKGNLNNYLGLPISMLSVRKEKVAVLEVGISERDEMEGLARILQPDLAIVTTISPAHTENIGSLENVAHEKEKLASQAQRKVFLGSACASYNVFLKNHYPECHWVLSESTVPAMEIPDFRWIYRVSSPDIDSVELSIESIGDFRLAATTAGMLENIALALVLAADLGVSQARLQERLLNWRPAAERGEIFNIGPVTIYADHYNANPSSMADAIDFFNRRFPSCPRFWVIGGMEELGEESELWHRRVAAAIPVKGEDRVLLVGKTAKCMFDVLANGQTRAKDVVFCETIESAKEVLAADLVPGTAVFLKGSRKHRLEKSLEIIRNAILS